MIGEPLLSFSRVRDIPGGRFMATLELLRAGRGSRAVVIIPGFLTQESDFSYWATSLRSGRFGGDTWVLRWPSGSLREMSLQTGPVGFAALTLAKLTGPISAIPGGVALAVASHRYWRRKVESARSTARRVRRMISTLRRRHGYREIVLLAHSLGAELTWAMLESSGSAPFDHIVLLGGASSATDGCWADLAHHAPVYNVSNRNDRVLYWFYRVAEWDEPLGLTEGVGRLIDVDASTIGLGGLGHDYHPVFSELEAPHRWRPWHF